MASVLVYESHLELNISATGKQFVLQQGGYYDVGAVATWGGGTVKLQLLGPDGTTWLDQGSSTTFTANGHAVVQLAPGQYRVSVTTSTAVYCGLCRVPVS